jgi:hypothetical protein
MVVCPINAEWAGSVLRARETAAKCRGANVCRGRNHPPAPFKGGGRVRCALPFKGGSQVQCAPSKGACYCEKALLVFRGIIPPAPFKGGGRARCALPFKGGSQVQCAPSKGEAERGSTCWQERGGRTGQDAFQAQVGQGAAPNARRMCFSGRALKKTSARFWPPPTLKF